VALTATTTTLTSTVVTTDGVPRTLAWSDAGELLRDGDDTYQWDAAGRLTQTTVDASRTITLVSAGTKSYPSRFHDCQLGVDLAQ
jgi:YD repeat-containing protein